jgi:hypothetical protein
MTKNIIHVNSSSMVKDFIFKHGSDNKGKVQTFTLVT